jgi:uncharacterized protein YdeI (YjbR/CyaY-like superfamily)
MKLGKTLSVTDRKAWRAWLAKHHATAKEIWLVYHKKHTGKPSVPYNDAVEEALCYGWIDSTVKSIDDGCYAQRFTPRRPDSAWSELNKERARRLIKAAKMAPAGLVAMKGSVRLAARGTHAKPSPVKVAPDIRKALQQGGAWTHFMRFPETYRRIRISWIEGGRGRPQFMQRLRYFVGMTAKGKKYGMLQ